MGQGGYVKLCNRTPYRWRRTYQHSYQMHWNFPEHVDSNSEQIVYVEWDQGLFTTESDDAGEASYEIEGPGHEFQVQARNSNGFNISVVMLNFPTQAGTLAEKYDLDWKHDGLMPFYLQGTAGSFQVALSDPWTGVPRTSWMGSIPDATPLTELTIPGTHDSATFRIKNLISRTQDMTVRQQLDIGIRALDIRCRHYRDAFPIHHGSDYANIAFDEVLSSCYEFLRAFPTETVIMSVKDEHESAENTRRYEQTFDTYIMGHESSWYLKDAVPTLGDVRGKIVLIRRFEASSVKGVDARSAPGWKDNATFDMAREGYALKIQDIYDFTAFWMNGKWDAVREHLDLAYSGSATDWYLNFASGGGVKIWPTTVAGGINDRLADHLRRQPTGRYGTLLLDFPSPELVNSIISANREDH